MNSSSDFLDTDEIMRVRIWLDGQGEEIKAAAAREVAKMRVFEASQSFLSLRFMHAESTRRAALEGLQAPNVMVAFEALELDPEKFAIGAEFEVRRLGTTRPDDYWRACGVGRPKGKRK